MARYSRSLSPYALNRDSSQGFDYSPLVADSGDPSGKSYEHFSLAPSKDSWGKTRFSDDYTDAFDLDTDVQNRISRNKSYADAYRMAASRQASPDYGVNAKPESFGTTLAKGAAGAAISAGTSWLVTAGFAAI